MSDAILEGSSYGKLYLPTGYLHRTNNFVYLPLRAIPVDISDRSLGLITGTECAGMMLEDPQYVGFGGEGLDHTFNFIGAGFRFNMEYRYEWAGKELYQTMIYLFNLAHDNIEMILQPHVDNDFKCRVKINPKKTFESWSWEEDAPFYGYAGSIFFVMNQLFSKYPDRSLIRKIWTDRTAPAADGFDWTDRSAPGADALTWQERFKTTVGS